MGCTTSRVENEDTVWRCKEHRRLMIAVVNSRHLLATAHSRYLHSLRLTASSLSRFAAGEPLAVTEHTAPVLLHPPMNPSSPSLTVNGGEAHLRCFYSVDVDVVLIYPFDVCAVVLDTSTGALAVLSSGFVLVDMTTSDPALAVEIAAAASAAGLSAIDAPVSDGDHGARNGTLSIFAGGDERVVRRLGPLFQTMGKVNYMGRPGSGQRAKLGNQIAIASTMVGLVEGMMYAHKAGLQVGNWLVAISSGAAGSKSLEL